MIRTRPRLCVVATHPIQYQAPLWRRLADSPDLDLTVYFLSRHGTEERADPSFGKTFAWDIPLLDGYRHEFIPSVSIPGVTGKKESRWSVTSALFARNLTERLRNGDFDAVLVHGYASGAAWSGTIAAWRTGIPVIVRGESHDRGRQRSFWQSVRRGLVSRWMGHIDMVIAIGKLNRVFWRDMGIDDCRILLSPYAVDNDRFRESIGNRPERAGELRAGWGAELTDTVFLFAGKLTAVKAPELALAAFEALGNRQDAHLVFVGAGPLEDELRAFERRTGLRNVHWAGFVNQSEIPHYYRAADVLVLPSRHEPWGLVVNEAMACGTPAIVSDRVGSGPDLVEDFEAGCVFPVDDGVALRRCMESALDPDRRKSWAARLAEFRQRVCLQQNVEAIGEAVRIVSSHRSRPRAEGSHIEGNVAAL